MHVVIGITRSVERILINHELGYLNVDINPYSSPSSLTRPPSRRPVLEAAIGLGLSAAVWFVISVRMYDGIWIGAYLFGATVGVLIRRFVRQSSAIVALGAPLLMSLCIGTMASAFHFGKFGKAVDMISQRPLLILLPIIVSLVYSLIATGVVLTVCWVYSKAFPRDHVA